MVAIAFFLIDINYLMKTINTQRVVKLLLLTLFSTTLFFSCKKLDDEPIVYGDAKFRIVNAVQGSAAQDLYQGDTKITTSAIAYGEASGYLTVKAGNSTISFRSGGGQTVNAINSVGVNTNDSYTVFYTSNLNGSGEITGYTDNNTVPAAGKIHIRFLNLGGVLTNAINISYSDGRTLFNGLGYKNVTEYGVIDANTELKFSLVGGANSTVIPGSSFQAGKTYMVWFDAANTTTAQYHIVAQN
jgi:hypothetical protein